MANRERPLRNWNRFYRALALALFLMSLRSPLAQARTPYADSELRAVETSEEGKIRLLRNEEITQLRIALGRRSPSNRRADLYLRLAEIHIEAYRADYNLEGRVHEKRLEHGQEDKFIDHGHSQPSLAAGIKACKDILGFGIPFQKLDEVYYFLGFNYSELGDRNQGIKYFDQLTRQFPSSPYVGEAYKEMGDAAYDANNFRRSQALYEQAAQHGNAETLPRIYHKLAWSYYRTKQFDRAVETMKQAIASAQKSGEKFLSLKEEALRDMAVFMTESGRVEEALAYFQSVVGDKQFYPRVLEKLGRQYERNVEPVKATQVYESLLKTSPDSEAGFRVLVKLVDLDLRRGRYREALVRLNGVKVPKAGEPETLTAALNLRAMIRRTATEHHEKFRKQASRPDLEIAESYYAAYLGTFLATDDPRHETPEIQMYLAEVKRELGKSQEASQLYRQVVDSKDKRYAKEAGALWTASLSEAIRKSTKDKPSNGKAVEPSPLEIEFIDAADRLQEALGDTNEGRESALRAAEVLAGYKVSQKDAIKRIRKIIERSPKSPQAITAARLWVQLKTESDVDELREVMKELRENTVLMAADAESGNKLRGTMADQDTSLKIGIIAKNEKSNDFGEAAKNYEAFGNEANQRELAEKAYGNALSSYLRVGDALSVTRVTERWLKRFPKSPKAAEVIRGTGTRYLIDGKFPQAAELFQDLGREAGDADSLETSARLYEGMGDTVRAQQLWSTHQDAFPTHAHHWSITLDLARSLEGSNQDSLAAATYRKCMTGPAEFAAECGARLADLYFRNKDVAEAKVLFHKVSALAGAPALAASSRGRHKGNAKGQSSAYSAAATQSPYIGYARYRLAELMESEARFEPMVMPEAKLKKGLGQRLEFLEPLSRAYLSAVDAGGPWAVSALERLASWAMGFADEVDNIAPLPGVDVAGIAQFHKNLASVSGPLRKKAVNTWSQGYSKALASETLSPSLPLMADRLADARVSGLGRAQGVRGRLRLAGLASDGGEAGKSASLQNIRERLVRNAQDANAWVDYGNLLWGDGKPLLAKLTYDRALSLNPRNPSALNNRGVLLISSQGEEDWFNAAEGQALFLSALRQDDFFLPAKMNRASLLNYYRLFEKAKPYWEQVVLKAPGADTHDGLAVALQGVGQGTLAESSFLKAQEAGAPKSRFAALYHEAARASVEGGMGAQKCLERLGDLNTVTLSGFEKSAVEHLQRTCTIWKSESKSKAQ